MNEKIFKEQHLFVSSVAQAAATGPANSALAAGQASIYTADGALLSATNAGNAGDSMKSKFVVASRPKQGSFQRKSKFIPSAAVTKIIKRAGVAAVPFSVAATISQGAEIASHTGYVNYEVEIYTNTDVDGKPRANSIATFSLPAVAPFSDDALADAIIAKINSDISFSPYFTASQPGAGQFSIVADPILALNPLYQNTQLYFTIKIKANLIVDDRIVKGVDVAQTAVTTAGNFAYNEYTQVREAERTQLGQLPTISTNFIDENQLYLASDPSVPLYTDYTLELEKVAGYDEPNGSTITIKVPSTDVNFEDFILDYFALFGKVTAITVFS